MIKKITYLIFFLFIFSIAKAEIIKEIIIEGNNRISDETIRVYGEIELNKNFTENEINKVLKDDGEMVFLEPLGTNPLINLYRKLTPKSRSVDEHPFVERF